MARKRCLIPLVLTFFIAFGAYAQTQHSLEKTLNNLTSQATEHPFEKVYLHMDKPYYGAGDTIWFKAYTVMGAQHFPTVVSGVLNVELVNQQNAIVKQLKLHLDSGLAYGDIPLGDTITAGNYRLRAYTNWMRNFGGEYYFDKTFAIVNAVRNTVFTNTKFNYLNVNGQDVVRADIAYFGLDGKPFVSKPVKYKVNIGPYHLNNGNAITNNQGNIQVSFSGPPEGATYGEIATSIQAFGSTSVDKSVTVKAMSQKVDVQFFPESGQMVNGLISKVAFKAIGADGLGVNVKGLIIDDQGSEVTTFGSTHLGMGTFFLSPQPGRTYKASLIYPDGSKGLVGLPKAAGKGYIMAVHADSANVVVKINQKDYNSDMGDVTLVAQNQGQVFLQGNGTPGKNTFTAIIAKSKLPTGIVQFTLFSATGQPLNERLVFVRNDDQLRLMANTSQSTYKPRQQVQIGFNAKTAYGQPVQGNFSVAVIDESKVKTDEINESSILADLLLTSNLKGYIEKPGYYFENPNKITDADLDALLLTQGYHGYSWQQVMSNTQPAVTFMPEKAITISGMLVNKLGMAIPKSKITLLTNGNAQATDTLTDSKGRFSFYLDFLDGENFIFKVPPVYQNNSHIEFDKPVLLAGANKNWADIQTSPESILQNYLQADKTKYDAEVKSGVGNHATLLKEVKINTVRPKTERQLKIEQAVEYSSNLNGRGNADQVIIADDLEGRGCPTLEACLAGKLVGAIFMNGWPTLNRPITMPTKGNPSGRVYMMIVVDNIPVAIMPGLPANAQLPPVESISSIEVLRSGGLTAIYGSRAAAGVIIITTKHGGSMIDATIDARVRPLGFFKPDVFYSPKYEVNSNSAIPDLRSTIYWNPSVKTDKEGNAVFNFFNADGNGNYRLVIEGMDKAGNLGRSVMEYKVN